MKEKIISVSIALVMVLSILSIAFVPTASSSIEIPDYEPMIIGPEFREKDVPIDMESIPEIPEHHSGPGDWEVGEAAIWLFLDDYTGYYYLDYFKLKAVGTTAEIWVQVDLSWPEGDPRAYPTILDEQIAYLLEEFETNIYPIDTTYFGVPDFHDGSNAELDGMLGLPPEYYYEETGRNVILVSNIRDENYYDYTYPYYIAGFYSSSFEDPFFDRNIINIDTWQWEERIGPEGYEWISGIPVDRPYLYESVIAHEYQHLIHADYNPGDATFMNEGCSMYAEILCGYGVSWGHVNSYLYTPDNSLTVWEDQGGINILADYGAATLWAVYLSDHYGGAAFLSHFVQAGIPGIEGINAALEHFGYDERFDDVYFDWRIANLIHRDEPGEGRYNYVTLDLGDPEAIPAMTHPVPHRWTAGTDFGNTITILGYDTGVAKLGAYGTDYVFTKALDEEGELFFDGDDAVIYGWTMTEEGYWYSDGINEMDALLVGTAYVDLANPTLEITTKYSIEDYWDFGFVQVSINEGETWTSLENEYTTSDHDPGAYPAIIENLPGLNGTSEGWPEFMTMSFDLSAYAGETVLIGFRYMTDWATLYEGWYISEASVSGTPLELTPIYPEADFFVTLLGVKKATPPVGLDKKKLVIEDADIVEYMGTVPLDDLTETGTFDVGFTEEFDYLVLIVSTDQGPVDYIFKFDYENGRGRGRGTND